MKKKPVEVKINLKDLGLSEDVKVVNMWTGGSLGEVFNDFSQSIKLHASGLYKFNQ
ncbi:hypothetical protein C799_03011 [Bacteroides thetaiotaomicron dnLKV9]|uniref:Uncharacterized protein n=1 Tax=Bacteroides thetaiotaomicron dnLKV9 TaxID=1235785 RepID=R9HAX0_BACT4|nr:hypothetical protein [Bacteroides thetaiotaomicron]EOS01157.1 hypothetical protein C799_03011 [Bacteroides thetaiotaomicron dnLKV9]